MSKKCKHCRQWYAKVDNRHSGVIVCHIRDMQMKNTCRGITSLTSLCVCVMCNLQEEAVVLAASDYGRKVWATVMQMWLCRFLNQWCKVTTVYTFTQGVLFLTTSYFSFPVTFVQIWVQLHDGYSYLCFPSVIGTLIGTYVKAGIWEQCSSSSPTVIMSSSSSTIFLFPLS